ncbi:MAG: exodeoxyribonuclease VII large subunit [Planctomycetes bacterium]|nr:exodeoxyribonuclease VII large subunit [Planctomycetota bacterium]
MPQRRRPLFGYDPELARPQGAAGPLTISELNRLVRGRLESDFPRVEVRGEISNFSAAASGHLYFSLKDAEAQLDAVVWRGSAARLDFRPEDGLEVVARGRLSLFEPRGRFQMIVEAMRLEGRGGLEARFLALKAHYQALGWFAAELKKPLPFLPAVIGLVTSATGAAVHDVLRSIYDRFPRAHVRLVPVRVQGRGAAEEIAAAIDRLDRLGLCEVMIVGRGGGSLEDLWAFNEAPVVEAIHRARTPIVSAVGHEVDVSLADLVADFRALTPTAAGEAVVPCLLDLEDQLARERRKLGRTMGDRLRRLRLELDSLGRSWALREPLNLLHRTDQRLDDLRRRLAEGLRGRLRLVQRRLDALAAAPALRDPRHRLERERARLDGLRLRLEGRLRSGLDRAAATLERQERLLEGLSPLRVLERGYSITRRADGGLIRSTTEVAPGDRVSTRLADGEFESRVEA